MRTDWGGGAREAEVTLCFHTVDVPNLRGEMTDSQRGAIVAMLQDRLQLTGPAADRCLAFMFAEAGVAESKATASAMILWLRTAKPENLRWLSRRYMEAREGQGVLGG